MAHDHRFSHPSKIVFSVEEKISLHGADLRWQRVTGPCHVLVDDSTHKAVAFFYGDVLRMMANGEMIVAHAPYDAPS